MKIILVSRRHSRTWAREIKPRQLVWASLCLLGVSFLVGGMSVRWLLSVQQPASATTASLDQATVRAWQSSLDTQSAQLAALKSTSQAQIAALARRVAEMHARLLRLDAVGERVTTVARLDEGEFDFGSPPPQGGPESAVAGSLEQQAAPLAGLGTELDRLTAIIDSREQQLAILSGLLANRQIRDEEFVAGRPIKLGWVSSKYGHRTDPFHGKQAWHGGIDFAGRLGADIVSVAGGVVTASGDHSGYGRMVEINHGNGYLTRYAHNQKNLVAVGDIVKKGQVIALMGSSGRSTGPHVHFEVYKNGRVVDPASYVYRTLR